jgi:hypothetical protein
MKKYRALKLVIGLCALALFPERAQAAFNISAIPYKGGSEIRFERASAVLPYTTEEVMVTVTSTIAKRYQIAQTLLSPLTNSQGQSLSRENMTVYALAGSSAGGTLTVQQEIAVSQGRQIIYISNAAGTTDSFKLSYILKPPFNVPSGTYRGRISFTLEPIDSNEQSVTVVLNISAEIASGSTVEMKTATGSSVIRLNSSRFDEETCDVIFTIKGSMGTPFRISQALSGIVESTEGNRLLPGAIRFRLSQARSGMGPNQDTFLSDGAQDLYLSSPAGGADNFVITYTLTDPEKQKAGRYRGKIRYFLEGASGEQLIGNLDLEIEVARLFDLKITPEMGGTIEFRDLKPQSTPQLSEVVFEVSSNIGRPYQISQSLGSGLVNKEGKAVPEKNFLLREESLDTRGRLQWGKATPIRTGEIILFVSDPVGSSDKFKVIYELKPSYDIIAGDYSTRFTYSISEI